MRQALDGTDSHPLLERIQISKSFLHTNGTESHYLSPEPSRHSVLLCRAIKYNDTKANDDLWLSLELERPNRDLKQERSPKKSQLKGDLEHIVLMQCSQSSHLHSHEAEGSTQPETAHQRLWERSSHTCRFTW